MGLTLAQNGHFLPFQYRIAPPNVKYCTIVVSVLAYDWLLCFLVMTNHIVPFLFSKFLVLGGGEEDHNFILTLDWLLCLQVMTNHIVDVESMDVFPVGWCESNNYPLKPPRKLKLSKNRGPGSGGTQPGGSGKHVAVVQPG